MNELQVSKSQEVAQAGQGVGWTGNASVEIAQSREMAEVQAAVFMARKFPRDEIAATNRIMNACDRPTLAEVAVYEYSRGGTAISGPSIRLAEAVAQSWGNMQYGVRELDQRNGESTCEAFAWDMETNTRVMKSFKVSHLRHTKKGDSILTDPRDIYELVANNGARRVRACILGVVPGDIVELAVQRCEATTTAKADLSPEGIKKVVEAFGKYGISKLQIEKRIQRSMDSISAGQICQLRKIIASIKDGMSKAADWFETIPTEGAKEPSKKLTDIVAKKKDEIAPKNEPEPDGHDQEPNEEEEQFTDELPL